MAWKCQMQRFCQSCRGSTRHGQRPVHPVDPLNLRVTVNDNFLYLISHFFRGCFCFKDHDMWMFKVTCWPFTNSFGHLGRTSMAVKSVGVRNARTSLVVKSVRWASSRTVTAVLSASAEVGTSALPPLITTCFESSWKLEQKKKEYCTEYVRIETWYLVGESVQLCSKECIVLQVFVIICARLGFNRKPLLHFHVPLQSHKNQLVIINKIRSGS